MYKAFDFLTWPETLYKLMFSQKGFPNRWRTNKYREVITQCGLCIVKMESTERLDTDSVALIRPHLDKTLGSVPLDELSWMAFWMVLRHPDACDRIARE